MACVAQKNGHFCWDTTLKTLTRWKPKAGYELALPQMEVGDRMWVWEPMDMGSGHFSPMAKGTMDTIEEAPTT